MIVDSFQGGKRFCTIFVTVDLDRLSTRLNLINPESNIRTVNWCRMEVTALKKKVASLESEIDRLNETIKNTPRYPPIPGFGKSLTLSDTSDEGNDGGDGEVFFPEFVQDNENIFGS